MCRHSTKAEAKTARAADSKPDRPHMGDDEGDYLLIEEFINSCELVEALAISEQRMRCGYDDFAIALYGPDRMPNRKDLDMWEFASYRPDKPIMIRIVITWWVTYGFVLAPTDILISLIRGLLSGGQLAETIFWRVIFEKIDVHHRTRELCRVLKKTRLESYRQMGRKEPDPKFNGVVSMKSQIETLSTELHVMGHFRTKDSATSVAMMSVPNYLWTLDDILDCSRIELKEIGFMASLLEMVDEARQSRHARRAHHAKQLALEGAAAELDGTRRVVTKGVSWGKQETD